MKKDWLRGLLLGASFALLLAGGVALAQGHRVDAGCGTATIDGRAGQREWAKAAKVQLFSWEEAAPAVEVPIPLPQAGASQADSVQGELWVMNDASNLYLATSINLDNATFDPDWWYGQLYLLFTDEPDALDDQWAAVDCGPPLPGEGWIFAYKDAMGPDTDEVFIPDSEAGGCEGQEPLVGVQWEAAPDTSLVFEHAFDLNSSELDKVGPGDCFRLGLWLLAEGCEWGTGCPDADWLLGQVIWPAAFEYYPGTFGEVCLDPCEVEFVPEPGTLMLLGSGLAGLAGYATLRLRSGQALRWRARE